MLSLAQQAQALDTTVLAHFLLTGAVLFCIGLVGFLTRRNLIIVFLCTEMMFQGVVVSLVAFSKYHMNITGQTFVIFVLTIAACEAALALGLVVLMFRRKRTLDSLDWAQLRG
ncbi:NADH-quinone oxidoreductase subunit NuoK [Poriferisphaera sp. WC338]|uniref:NADH-quinone oxidoreductase subunit NuoK n=1 Tax=Poriferisphaera sp. WC338 TaxID=3425129 RepID=UPI003D8168F0